MPPIENINVVVPTFELVCSSSGLTFTSVYLCVVVVGAVCGESCRGRAVCGELCGGSCVGSCVHEGSCGSGTCVVGVLWGMSVGEGELCGICACGGNCLPSV